MLRRAGRMKFGLGLKVCEWFKQTLINSENVIPAQAGIHKNQQTGFPPTL